MKKLLFLLMLPMTMQAQTLQECQEAAEHNYPLIRQYDLIGKTTQLTVENIGKGWLPQVSASAQATLQSVMTQIVEKIRIISPPSAGQCWKGAGRADRVAWRTTERS